MGLRRTVRTGLALFAVGMVFIVVDLVAFAAGARDLPLWLNLACLLAPIGMVVAVGAALRRGREEQRQALRRLDSVP